MDITGENEIVLLRLQLTSETSATIEKEQMVSNTIYAVSVTATYILNGICGTAS